MTHPFLAPVAGLVPGTTTGAVGLVAGAARGGSTALLRSGPVAGAS